MKKLGWRLELAGLTRFTATQAVIFVCSISVVLATWVHLSFGVSGLTFFALIAVPSLAFELLNLLGKQRSEQLVKLWPGILDTLQSAAGSGSGIVDSFEEIVRNGPLQVRYAFAGLIQKIDNGLGFDDALDWFKSQFGIHQADRFVELIRIVNLSGGVGYLESLRTQASNARIDIALWGEVESKQGWVSGTAKLAIVAPWIIVATLATRSENAAIYNSPEGLAVLLFGLVVSLVAYRMVGLSGALSKPRRVFTK